MWSTKLTYTLGAVGFLTIEGTLIALILQLEKLEKINSRLSVEVLNLKNKVNTSSLTTPSISSQTSHSLINSDYYYYAGIFVAVTLVAVGVILFFYSGNNKGGDTDVSPSLVEPIRDLALDVKSIDSNISDFKTSTFYNFHDLSENVKKLSSSNRDLTNTITDSIEGLDNKLTILDPVHALSNTLDMVQYNTKIVVDGNNKICETILNSISKVNALGSGRHNEALKNFTDNFDRVLSNDQVFNDTLFDIQKVLSENSTNLLTLSDKVDLILINQENSIVLETMESLVNATINSSF